VGVDLAAVEEVQAAPRADIIAAVEHCFMTQCSSHPTTS